MANVLSLFDGKSSGYTAMELAGIQVTKYYSAEIDKYAIQVSNAIHPNQIRLGDVTKWRDWNIDWASIDYLFGGFPCQAWSMAGKQLGDKDERGMLFWVMLDIMKHVKKFNPNFKFLIENVKMKKEFEEYITFHMTEAVGDLNKTLINSMIVTPHDRSRYYWANWDCKEFEKINRSMDEIIDWNYCNPNSDGWHKWWIKKSEFQIKKKYSNVIYKGDSSVAICQTARQFASWNGNFVYIGNGKYRNLTPRECFRLQTVPEHYIDKILSCGVSNSQLYKIAGNGWTDEVIAHILRCSLQNKPIAISQ